MTVDNRAEQNLHPEGMTPAQETLAGMLFDTKTLGKVQKRYPHNTGFRFENTTREVGIIDFAQDDFEFALKVHEEKPDAPLSPFFVNLRNLSPEVLGQIGIVMHELAPYFERQAHIGPDVCAGVPKAGVPLAQAYSEVSGIPMVEIFDKEEGTGGGRKIIHKNESVEDTSVRLIDDLASQGLTKLESVREAREMGYAVDSFYVLIDREQGGIDALKQVVVDVKAAIKITQLFDFGLRTGRITREQYDRATQYLKPGN